MDRFGFQRLLVLHGSAIAMSGRLCVVAGPAGIGKSTVLKALQRSGEGRLIEDGVVLVGERDGNLEVVETGTLGVMQTAGRIATTVRRLTFTNTSVFSRPIGPRPVTRSATHRVLRRLATVSFYLAVMTRVSFTTFTPRTHHLDRVVLGSHSDDDGPSVVIDPLGQVTAIRNLRSMVPADTALIEFSPIGPRREVARRIRLAMSVSRPDKSCDPSRRGREGTEQGHVRG